MISLLLTLIALAGLAAAGFGVFLVVQAVQRDRPARGGALLTIVGLLAAVLFFVMSAGVVEIQPSEVGVVFNSLSGELSDEPLGPGMHVIIPGVQSVTIYSVAQQNYTMSGRSGEGAVQGDDAVEALTNDGQQVRLDIAVIYAIDPTKASIVHQRWQERYQDGLIRSTVRAVTREVLGQFDVQEIYGEKRSELADEIQVQVQTAIGDDGFLVNDVQVRNIIFSEEYVNSIEQKQVAQQQALEAEFRVEQKRQEAEQLKAEAEGDKQAAITRAQGEAEALRLINEQLEGNPLLIQWRYIEKLNDNVRIVVIPSNSPFLFDMESLMQQAGGIDGGTTEPAEGN